MRSSAASSAFLDLSESIKDSRFGRWSMIAVFVILEERLVDLSFTASG